MNFLREALSDTGTVSITRVVFAGISLVVGLLLLAFTVRFAFGLAIPALDGAWATFIGSVWTGALALKGWQNHTEKAPPA